MYVCRPKCTALESSPDDSIDIQRMEEEILDGDPDYNIAETKPLFSSNVAGTYGQKKHGGMMILLF